MPYWRFRLSTTRPGHSSRPTLGVGQWSHLSRQEGRKKTTRRTNKTMKQYKKITGKENRVKHNPCSSFLLFFLVMVEERRGAFLNPSPFCILKQLLNLQASLAYLHLTHLYLRQVISHAPKRRQKKDKEPKKQHQGIPCVQR